MLRRRARLLPLLLAAGGCAAPPAPPAFAPPDITAELVHFAGPMIGGPRSGVAMQSLDAEPAHAFALQGRVLVVERFPHAAVTPLATQTQLVVTQPGATPILPAARLGAGVGRVSPERAVEFLAALQAGAYGASSVPIELSGALPAGATAALRVASPDQAWTRQFALLVARDAALPAAVASAIDGAAAGSVASAVPLQVALVIDGRLPEARDATDRRSTSLLSGAQAQASGASAAPSSSTTAQDDDVDASRRTVNQKEGILVQHGLLPGGPPLVLVVPAPMTAGELRPEAALVLVLQVRPAPTGAAALAAHAIAVAQSLRSAERARVDQEQLAAALTENEAFLREMLSALSAMGGAGRHRSELLFVAAATGAKLTEDLALLADDATLQAFGQSLLADAQRLTDMGQRGTALGWLLERSAYGMFVDAATEGDLSPALAGLLLRHAGELGRSPASIEEVLAGSRDLAGFTARIVAENRLSLEDGNPAARVRAFDWLAARGVAPAGFDPLASKDERRAALAVDAERAATDGGGHSAP